MTQWQTNYTYYDGYCEITVRQNQETKKWFFDVTEYPGSANEYVSYRSERFYENAKTAKTIAKAWLQEHSSQYQRDKAGERPRVE